MSAIQWKLNEMQAEIKMLKANLAEVQSREIEALTELRKRAEELESVQAQAAEMRRALKQAHTHPLGIECGCYINKALSSDAGKGWKSPEDIEPIQRSRDEQFERAEKMESELEAFKRHDPECRDGIGPCIRCIEFNYKELESLRAENVSLKKALADTCYGPGCHRCTDDSHYKAEEVRRKA